MLRRLSIAFAIIAMTAMAGACSQKNENDQALDDYEKVVDKAIAASKGKTEAQFRESPEFKEIDKEGEAANARVDSLQSKFTPEQKKRMEAIKAKMMDAVQKMNQ